VVTANNEKKRAYNKLRFVWKNICFIIVIYLGGFTWFIVFVGSRLVFVVLGLVLGRCCKRRRVLGLLRLCCC